MKKAQSGGNAATLVALIAGLIILYILFLPPNMRNELLNITNETNNSEQLTDTLLMYEKPGTLSDNSMLDKYNNTHQLNDVSLYTKTQADELKTENPFYIKKNLFSEQKKTVTFKLADLENTDNIMMSFAAKTHSGRLIILLNGNEIYNSEITSYNVDPIQIPTELLTSEVNELEFSVSSPGIAFWATNEYSIISLTIAGFITDVRNQESMNTFVLTETEKSNMEKAKLNYFVYCQYETSKIDIYMNNVLVESSVPLCDSANSKEFSADILKEGTNTLVFKAYKGFYQITSIRIVPQFKSTEPYMRYFSLKQGRYDEIKNKNLKVNLTMSFADDEDKEFNLYINGYVTRVETKERTYTKNINDFLKDGNNAVKIEPKGNIHVLTLKVEVK